MARRTRKSRSRGSRKLRSEEHTSELQSLRHLVCRLLLEKKNYGRNFSAKRALPSMGQMVILLRKLKFLNPMLLRICLIIAILGGVFFMAGNSPKIHPLPVQVIIHS